MLGISLYRSCISSFSLFRRVCWGDQLRRIKQAPLAAVSKYCLEMPASRWWWVQPSLSLATSAAKYWPYPVSSLPGPGTKYYPVYWPAYTRFFKHPISPSPYTQCRISFCRIRRIQTTDHPVESAATLPIHLGVVLAVIRLWLNRLAGTERTFTIPGGIFVPARQRHHNTLAAFRTYRTKK